MARISYPDIHNPALAPVLERIVAERGSVLNLYEMLMHSPPVAAGWRSCADTGRFLRGRPDGSSDRQADGRPDRNRTHPADLHALKRISYFGVTFRTRSVEQVRDITARVLADLGPFLRSGALSLPIDRVFGFDELGEAFARMRANQHFGRIIVAMHP